MAFRVVILLGLGLLSQACDKSAQATQNSLQLRCDKDQEFKKTHDAECRDTNPGTYSNTGKVLQKK